ncbi:Uncharacterised protein [Salmonella enterica subsp. arizonae]|uniref:Uncharacterized protein n=1 Tax=Salmonella enterica subsp. arizonae TaxID=59203 RepID=A0A447R6W5_SALER|nr:Uncharacterised protein [Salmonella enterica subsp. arizonae]
MFDVYWDTVWLATARNAARLDPVDALARE